LGFASKLGAGTGLQNQIRCDVFQNILRQQSQNGYFILFFSECRFLNCQNHTVRKYKGKNKLFIIAIKRWMIHQ
jgi:hypothetical protein